MKENMPLRTPQEALHYYCGLLGKIPQVIEVRTAPDGNNLIAWTIISTPPFQNNPRGSVLSAMIATTTRMADTFMEIQIMNIQELPEDSAPLPGEAVWKPEPQDTPATQPPVATAQPSGTTPRSTPENQRRSPGRFDGSNTSQQSTSEDAPMAQTRGAAPMAIVYDFDGTLAPGRMQDRQFIPSTIGMDVDQFWQDVDRNTIQHQADPILSYMFVMLEKARQSGTIIQEQALAQIGPGTIFFPGVQEWFGQVNQDALQQGIRLRHFVISSGNSEIIENTTIAGEFERIYASRFLYNQDGQAVWPARVINFINKPNYLYRINKGALDQQDLFVINEFIPEPERAVPFENIVYIGDGETDVPCFQTITSQGGLAVAVHQPGGGDDARRYLNEGRVAAAVNADYRPNSSLHRIVQCQIGMIAARTKLRNAIQPKRA